jgi:hypothetical protein
MNPVVTIRLPGRRLPGLDPRPVEGVRPMYRTLANGACGAA